MVVAAPLRARNSLRPSNQGDEAISSLPPGALECCAGWQRVQLDLGCCGLFPGAASCRRSPLAVAALLTPSSSAGGLLERRFCVPSELDGLTLGTSVARAPCYTPLNWLLLGSSNSSTRDVVEQSSFLQSCGCYAGRAGGKC